MEIDWKNIPDINNFARVFEIPRTKDVGHHDYCFGGGYQYPIKIVDWFNPMPNSMSEIVINTEEEFKEKITEFLLKKDWLKPNFAYLVVCDFGYSILINGDQLSSEEQAHETVCRHKGK